jgi:hypothetical protein
VVGLNKILLVTHRSLNIVKKPALLRLVFRLERSAQSMKDIFSFEISEISVIVDRYRRIQSNA